MRVLLLALMIALLPVRGWVGHAMAVDMAAQQVMQAQQAAPAAEPGAEASAMPEDCPMHAQASSPAELAGSTETPAADGSHCEGCNTCQLCLALASFTWEGPSHAAFAPHAEPLAGGSNFSSADRASGFKPPIS
ncbi:hypothetical protein [Polaromonas aquatica]|uniref:hypothetical protein n=1 Tax=Polaromonas aquatica TaxID=332657 RepID=UPI003D64AFFA